MSYTKLQKLKWASVRVGIIMMCISILFSFGLSGFILLPINNYFVQGRKDIFPWFKKDVVKTYWRYVFWGFSLVPNILKFENDGFFLNVKLTDPPMIAPDMTFISYNDRWEGGKNTCAGCDARCCKGIGGDKVCPLLDENNGCKIYGSPLWRYFNCGRFPKAQSEINYYKCPKFVIKEN